MERDSLPTYGIFSTYIPTQKTYLYGEYALQSIYLCISVRVLLSLQEEFRDPVQPEMSGPCCTRHLNIFSGFWFWGFFNGVVTQSCPVSYSGGRGREKRSRGGKFHLFGAGRQLKDLKSCGRVLRSLSASSMALLWEKPGSVSLCLLLVCFQTGHKCSSVFTWAENL